MTLQSFLGKNYKWFYFITFGYKTESAYRGNNIVWSLSGLFYCLVLAFTWIVATKNSTTYSTNEIVSYVIFTNIWVSLHNSWLNVSLGNRILNGTFNTSLLFPTSYFWHQFWAYIGRSVINYFLLNLPAFLVIILVFKDRFLLPSSANNLILTFGLVPICYFLYHCIVFIIGCSAFWLKQTDAVDTFYYLFRNFLRGDNIPVGILVGYLGVWLTWTPFAWFGYRPFEIYLGKYSQIEIIQTFVGGIIWCLVLFILARIVFKMGLKRNEAVGL